MSSRKFDIEYMMSHKMGADDTFEFHCKACGKCCKHREDVLLTPYDLFRIARFFGRTPAEIVTNYCDTYVGDASRCPVVRIRPVPPDNACPFLRGKKCSVHQDKPIVCAVFPLSRLYQPGEDAPFYVLQPDVSCGKKDRTVSVRQWMGHLCNEESDCAGILWGSCTTTIARALITPWTAFSAEQRTSTFQTLLTLLYLMYDVKKPFLEQFQKNALLALLYLNKLVELPDVPAWLPLENIPDAEQATLYKLLLLKAYGLYKRNWSAERGVQMELVNEDIGLPGGSCFACLQEFESAEFRDAEYIKALLDAGDFAKWNQLI